MRIQAECEGVPALSKTNSCHHPGGETKELGGVVMVTVVPEIVNAGKIVRAPMEFPCVLETAGLTAFVR